MGEHTRDAEQARWRREYQVSLGLLLMWVGSTALSLNVSLLEGRLNLAPILVRTLVVGLIWILSLYSVRTRGANRALAELQALPAGEFAAWLCVRLRDLGYTEAAPTGGARGVDLIAARPGEVAVVQCRRYGAQPVREHTLRSLHRAMRDLGADRGYLATTGRLTSSAVAWLGDKPIAVWDGESLARLWLAPRNAACPRITSATASRCPSPLGIRRSLAAPPGRQTSATGLGAMPGIAPLRAILSFGRRLRPD